MSPLMSPSPPSPPPEPPEAPSVYCTPSPQSKAATPSPTTRSFLSRQHSYIKPSPLTKHVLSRLQSSNSTISNALTPEFPHEHDTTKSRVRLLLRKHRRTNPAVWCVAIICLIFCLLVIFFGIATLIIFLVVKPKTPILDTSHATLNVIYFDTPGHFNGDFTFIANFSNPNKKLNVKFEHAIMQLYFKDDVIATQSIQPFSQRSKETGVVVIHFISSLVTLPPSYAKELQTQVLSNKVLYSVRGTFKVRASWGAVHFSYWLHGWCELQMSSPPSGSLMARTCKTKR
ncbi:putative Late embryogenesis abundant protein [Helianthus annuus]|nr:putative Late embryogenesis abundant protein [Helianthus annuus]